MMAIGRLNHLNPNLPQQVSFGKSLICLGRAANEHAA